MRRANLDGSMVQDVVAAGLQHPVDVAVDGVNDKLYFADNGGPSSPSIRRADLDGGEVEIVLNRLSVSTLSPETIVVDPAAGKIFWSNQAYGLWSAGLAGENPENIHPHHGLPWLPGLALDPGGMRLFWSDDARQTIYRLSLAGAKATDLFPVVVASPLALTIDAASASVYWTEEGLYPSYAWRIQRASVPKGPAEPLPLTGGQIWHVAHDASTETMFWPSSPMVMISTEDGSDARPLANLTDYYPPSPERPHGLALDAARGHLYVGLTFYEPHHGSALRIDTRTGEFLGPAIPFGLGSVRGIALDIPGNWIYWAGMRYEESIAGFTITGFVDRVSLDGGTVEPIFEEQDYYFGEVSMSVDPHSSKLYWVNSEYEGIVCLDLVTHDASVLPLDPQAKGVLFDPCADRVPASLTHADLLARCFTGPHGMVDESCACADVTSDYRVDLRDISAWQLAFTPD